MWLILQEVCTECLPQDERMVMVYPGFERAANLPRRMTSTEAAHLLGIAPGEIQRLIDDGFLEPMTVAGALHVALADVQHVARIFPSEYTLLPAPLQPLIAALREGRCDEVDRLLDAFRPAFEREDLAGLMFMA